MVTVLTCAAESGLLILCGRITLTGLFGHGKYAGHFSFYSPVDHGTILHYFKFADYHVEP